MEIKDKNKILLAIGFIKAIRDERLGLAYNKDEYEEIEQEFDNILEKLEN